LPAGVENSSAVQVCAGRSGGCGCVGNFVRACRHHADRFEIDAQAVGCNLADFRVEPLAHFRTAVIHLDAAIAVHQDKRACLVEEGRGEGDSELGRRDGDAAFGVGIGVVEFRDGLGAAIEVAGSF
jgi:hypothetical protein